MHFEINPTLAVWELTLKCNLKCIHCGSTAGTQRTQELTTQEAYHLIHDLSTLGFKGITLMGGEIFMRNDWYNIAQEIKKKDITLSIVTNGYWNPTKIIPQLTKLHLDCLMIGLDAGTYTTHNTIRNTTGAFSKTLTFLKAAQEAHLPVGIITTIHKQNFTELPHLQHLIEQKQIPLWQIQEATPIGRFPRHLLLTKEQYYTLGLYITTLQKKYTTQPNTVIAPHNFGFHSQHIPNLSPYPPWNNCLAGKTIIGIQSNGNIKGCLALPDSYIEGNIRQKNIIEIWKNPTSFSYNRNFNPQNLGPNCKNCQYGPTCQGGCTTRSATITGQPHNDPYCYYHIEQQLHHNQKKHQRKTI